MALIASLADEEPYIRISTIHALKTVGRPAADKAIPALQALMNDPQPEVRDAAKEALDDLTKK